MKPRAFFVLFLGLCLGALIWGASPIFTGEREPWDAPIGYYVLALVIAGFTATLVSPRHFWLAPIGIFGGQLLFAIAFLPSGPLWFVGTLFLSLYALAALAGAVAAFLLSMSGIARHPAENRSRESR